MSGAHTLKQTEEAVSGKIEGLDLDVDAMIVVANLYRLTSAIRNHLEQSVLKDAGLTWTAFVVLWVVWIWDSLEARHVAAEAGITKGTLTGVAQTLEARGLLTRKVVPEDRRRMVFSLTPKGADLMQHLYPAFNQEERFVVSGLGQRRIKDLGNSLRRMITHMEANGAERQMVIAKNPRRSDSPKPNAGAAKAPRTRRRRPNR